MARRRRSNRIGRDSSHIANLRLPRYVVSRVRFPSPTRRLLEDRRFYHPLGRLDRPAFATRRSAARLVARHQDGRMQTKARISFADPRRVMVCVRRKERREVLFARGVGGSKRRQRKPRRTPLSAVSCK